MARVMKPPLPASSLSGRGPPRFPKPARKFPARFMTRRPTVAGFAAQSRRASPRGGAFAAADSKGVSGRADPPTLNSPGITATQSSGPEAARRPRQPRKSRRGVPGPRPTRSGPAPACAASPLDSAPSPCSTLRGNRAGRGGQDVIAADVPMALIRKRGGIPRQCHSLAPITAAFWDSGRATHPGISESLLYISLLYP